MSKKVTFRSEFKRQLGMLLLPRSMWQKKKKRRVVKTYYMGKPHGMLVDGKYYKY